MYARYQNPPTRGSTILPPGYGGTVFSSRTYVGKGKAKETPTESAPQPLSAQKEEEPAFDPAKQGSPAPGSDLTMQSGFPPAPDYAKRNELPPVPDALIRPQTPSSFSGSGRPPFGLGPIGEPMGADFPRPGLFPSDGDGDLPSQRPAPPAPNGMAGLPASPGSTGESGIRSGFGRNGGGITGNSERPVSRGKTLLSLPPDSDELLLIALILLLAGEEDSRDIVWLLALLLLAGR